MGKQESGEEEREEGKGKEKGGRALSVRHLLTCPLTELILAVLVNELPALRRPGKCSPTQLYAQVEKSFETSTFSFLSFQM